MPCPAERVSRGCISEGTSHPRGPQDQAKEEMKTQMRTITLMATLCGSFSVCAPKYTPEDGNIEQVGTGVGILALGRLKGDGPKTNRKMSSGSASGPQQRRRRIAGAV